MRYTFPKPPTIKWEAAASAPPPVAARPKQLPYHKPELPADLSPGDWSLLSRLYGRTHAQGLFWYSRATDAR
jgi:hypothetical protein